MADEEATDQPAPLPGTVTPDDGAAAPATRDDALPWATIEPGEAPALLATTDKPLIAAELAEGAELADGASEPGPTWSLNEAWPPLGSNPHSPIDSRGAAPPETATGDAALANPSDAPRADVMSDADAPGARSPEAAGPVLAAATGTVDGVAFARAFAINTPPRVPVRPAHRVPPEAPHLRIARPTPAAPDGATDDGQTDPTAEDRELAALPPARGGGWTVVALCVGLALVACCTLVPQSDANRRLAYEQVKLKLDLEHLRKQVSVNQEFLRKVNSDPGLAERLAHRQMKMVREGTRVLDLERGSKVDMNPFLLTNVGPPPELPTYQPRPGVLSRVFLDARLRLYCTGLGLMLVAFGLVLGGAQRD